MPSNCIFRRFLYIALFYFAAGNAALLLEAAALPRPEYSSIKRPVKCDNKGTATKARQEFRNDCDPRFSKGLMSSRECVADGGKTYLCLAGKITICYNTELEKLDIEGGECFF